MQKSLILPLFIQMSSSIFSYGWSNLIIMKIYICSPKQLKQFESAKDEELSKLIFCSRETFHQN